MLSLVTKIGNHLKVYQKRTGWVNYATSKLKNIPQLLKKNLLVLEELILNDIHDILQCEISSYRVIIYYDPIFEKEKEESPRICLGICV